MKIDDIAQWEERWKSLLDDSKGEDRRWNWGDRYMLGISPNFERFAIERPGRTEGLTICDADAHSSRKRDLPIVDVDYSLAVAPWNRGPKPEFRSVGSQLILCATQ